MKRCFVISPIGPEGSDIREHADAVFNYIIKPAMDDFNIEAFRSDHLREPGKISEQMFREISTADVLIALLTGHNANVFYELAIAHAQDRPVIILIESSQTLPFDIGDMRCVYYDLKPKSVVEKVFVKPVKDHVRALEANSWKSPSLFGNMFFSQISNKVENGVKFFAEGHDFGAPDCWMKLLQETNSIFEIMGIHLGPWRGGKRFSSLLTSKAEDGCKVRILLMHPSNPSLAPMINETLTEVDLDDVTSEINKMSEYFSKIAFKNPNIEVRQIRLGTLHCQTTRTDDYGLYLPYLYGRRRRYSPLWQSSTGTTLYKLVQEEFQSIWQAQDLFSSEE